MNFFGHVVVASWRSDSPRVALGAMLPDFGHMCRGRLVRTLDDDVTRGVKLHHETDAVFHRLPSFGALEDYMLGRLNGRGVARGGAMGVAHVAVELLLDGVLLDHARACELYLTALEEAEILDGTPPRSIEWTSEAEALRWDGLRGRLRSRGLPRAYLDPELVTSLVATILSGYRTLALSARDEELVRLEMAGLQERVRRDAPTLMAELERGLAP